MPRRRTILLGLAASLTATSAIAAPRVAQFSADLRGDQPPAKTGSKARGAARIAVDQDAQSVDLDLIVTGIELSQLWDKLKVAPIGPIHFHHYGSRRHTDDPSVTLVLPVPFGPTYAATSEGFKVAMRGFSYAAGAALPKSNVTFDAFLAELRGGLVALNVHTNAFPDGEINGAVTTA